MFNLAKSGFGVNWIFPGNTYFLAIQRQFDPTSQMDSNILRHCDNQYIPPDCNKTVTIKRLPLPIPPWKKTVRRIMILDVPSA